jgi:hypothetical protein
VDSGFNTRFTGSFTSLRYNYSLQKCIASGSVSLRFLHKLSSCVTFVCITSLLLTLSVSASASVLTTCIFLNSPYLCLHLLKTAFCQPSREHLVDNFNFLYSVTTVASVLVTTETPLLKLLFPWQRSVTYTLPREYVCLPDNYTGNVVTVPLSSNWCWWLSKASNNPLPRK